MAEAIGAVAAWLWRSRRRVVPASLAITCLWAVGVTSAQPLTGTFVGRGVGRQVRFVRSEVQRNAWAGTLRFRLETSQEVLTYCIQLDVSIARDAQYVGSAAVEDLPNGCEIGYILDHFPAPEASNQDEAAARQLAIWHYSDAVDLDTIDDQFAGVRERAIEIAGAAAGADCLGRRVEPPQLRIEPAATTLAVGKRLVYAITATPLDAGRTISATLTGPAVFDDGGQLSTATLDTSGAASLGVTGNGSGESAITVVLPYQLAPGVVFSVLDPARPSQRLVLAEQFGDLAEAQSRAQWSVDSTSTPTTAPATLTPTGSPSVPATEAPTPATEASPTDSPTAAEHRPQPSDTPAPSPTRELPAKLPQTGGGGTSHRPVAALGLLLLGAWLLHRQLRLTGRAGQS